MNRITYTSKTLQILTIQFGLLRNSYFFIKTSQIKLY